MSQVTIEQALQLAIEHLQSGRLAEAESICRQILAHQPQHAGSLNLLGVIAAQVGRHDLAVNYYQRALALNPALADAHNNLGIILKSQGRIDEAIACYQRTLALRPNSSEAHYNLGIAWSDKGQIDQAAACFERALALRPDHPDAHYNLGVCRGNQGRMGDSIPCYQCAVELKPDHHQARYNLGIALWRERKQPDLAIECLRRAAALNPNSASTHDTLGNALKDAGQLDEAIACYRKALELDPQNITAHSNLLFALQYHPAVDSRGLFLESQRWNRQHAEPLKRFIQPHTNDRDPNRRFRIGYVSPNFASHVLALYFVPLLEGHDHQQFEIHCYSSVRAPDSITERLARAADSWHEVLNLSDEELAGQIRRDGIDILVDMTLQMADNRLLVFARKPAPVQVTWFAYPGSTGLETIDYRLTDPYLDPPAVSLSNPAGLDDANYSERSIRLPETFWCYDPLSIEPANAELPCKSNGFVTFGCLNNFCKVNDEVLSLWAKVLHAVAGSRLILLAPEGNARKQVMDRLGGEGIGPERVEFVAEQPRTEYLRTYHRIDIALDTFPYNGHTTSLDSFWMGVPVITLAGNTVVGRAGMSQLTNLGLPELIARNHDEFMRLAASLAADPARLGKVRAGLRERMRVSSLMDSARFLRGIEDAYRTMWREWCAKS